MIREHLTENDIFLESETRPACVGGELREGWNIPLGGIELGVNEFSENYVAKIQPFKAGGWELTCRSLDLTKIGRAMEANRRTGKREKPEAIDPLNQVKAAQRAKRKVRLLTKNMGATHLVTLNRQEGPNTSRWKESDWANWENGGREGWELEHGAFWNPEDWSKAWDRLRRLLVKVKGEFPYVAVLERHKKGNYHMHIAWAEAPGRKVNIGLVRGCWWSVLGGRGLGNVDVQFIKVRAGLERADRVAKYISKYTTKHFEDDGRFNKKRYWASRQDIEPARRYVLNASRIGRAHKEIERMFGFDTLADYRSAMGSKHELEDMFFFPDGSGFWMAFIPGKHGTVDPPF